MRELIKSKPWLPYVAPFLIYMGFLGVQSNANLLWLYPLKTLAVGATLWMFRHAYPELKPEFSWLAVAVGLAVIVLWVGLDPFYPKFGALMHASETTLSRWMHSPPPTDKPPAPFDPTTIAPWECRVSFIVFRIAGAVLVVPLMEEIFWRGFLIRWIQKEDFQSVPVGALTWKSFAITTLFFGLEHDQWLAGLLCGALYNWVYYRTRKLSACVIAHAVSNAALAAWVLTRRDWQFW